MPRRPQRRAGISHRLRIKAVQKLNHPAKHDDPELEAAETLRSDQFGDINFIAHSGFRVTWFLCGRYGRQHSERDAV